MAFAMLLCRLSAARAHQPRYVQDESRRRDFPVCAAKGALPKIVLRRAGKCLPSRDDLDVRSVAAKKPPLAVGRVGRGGLRSVGGRPRRCQISAALQKCSETMPGNHRQRSSCTPNSLENSDLFVLARTLLRPSGSSQFYPRRSAVSSEACRIADRRTTQFRSPLFGSYGRGR